MPYGAYGTQPLPQVPPSVGVLPTLPSGFPTGPAPVPVTAVAPTPAMPTLMAPPGEQPPQTVQSTLYTPGYLRTQIRRMIRVEFLIGTTGPLIDRIRTLLGVGASYILLRPLESDDILMCDIYSIKFVTTML